MGTNIHNRGCFNWVTNLENPLRRLPRFIVYQQLAVFIVKHCDLIHDKLRVINVIDSESCCLSIQDNVAGSKMYIVVFQPECRSVNMLRYNPYACAPVILKILDCNVLNFTNACLQWYTISIQAMKFFSEFSTQPDYE